jgi:hypothetical protein
MKKYFPRKGLSDAMLAITVASTSFSLLFLNLPIYGIGPNVWELSSPQFDYSPENRRAIDDINHLIPKDAAVSAQVNILPHLKARFEMYPFPLLRNSSYVVLNFVLPFKNSVNVIGVPFGTSGINYFSNAEQMMHDPEWGVVYCTKLWVVLEKGAPDNPELHQNAIEALDKVRTLYRDMRT